MTDLEREAGYRKDLGLSGGEAANLSGGPCKIRLVDAQGRRTVRICEPWQVDSEVERYKRDGYELDPHELSITSRKRTTNPSRL